MKTLLILIIMAKPLLVQATHIVGGEITYTYSDSDNYLITLILYRDCYYGGPQLDNPASIGVFDNSGNLLQELILPLMEADTLEPDSSVLCQGSNMTHCIQQGTYSTILNLPFIPGGYVISYQRCCRNSVISNITDPLSVGATYWTTISEAALLYNNSSPKFSITPPFYKCVGYPFSINHSAEDIDGDSIVYRLCTPYSGASQDFPMPQPPTSPPYSEINWASPYSLDNLLGGQPLTINPNTGELTGMPNTIGYFLVAICMEEYRNNELISLTRRDFQILVEACNFHADFENEMALCGDLEIDFINNSVGANTYLWKFNDPMNPDATSSLENPTFNFSGYGQYLVDLIINPGSDCSDTISKMVELIPPPLFTGDYDYDISGCNENILLNLIDNSIISVGDISFTEWTVSSGGDSIQAEGEHVQFMLPQSGDWLIELLLTSSEGCIFLLTDTISVCTNNTYDIAVQDYTIYPNPMETVLNIHIVSTDISVYQVDIFDIENRLVLQKSVDGIEKDFLFDLHELLPGAYFLSVISDQINYNSLLIKK